MTFPLFFVFFHFFFLQCQRRTFDFFFPAFKSQFSFSCIQETDFRKYINFIKMAKILRFPIIKEFKINYENKLKEN